MKNIGTMQYKDLFWSYKVANWIGIIATALFVWFLFQQHYQVTGSKVWFYWLIFTAYLNWLAIALVPAALIEIFKKKLKGKQCLTRIGVVVFVWIVMLIIGIPDNLYALHVMRSGDTQTPQSAETASSTEPVSNTESVGSVESAGSAKIAISARVASSTTMQTTPVMQSASFDCRNAASPVEIAICTHPQLSDLDGRLALAYKQLLSHDPLARPEQRDWLQQRNECGSDVSCLTSSYEGRLKKIQEIQEESEKLEGQIQQ